jgi:hypothetical protein
LNFKPEVKNILEQGTTVIVASGFFCPPAGTLIVATQDNATNQFEDLKILKI